MDKKMKFQTVFILLFRIILFYLMFGHRLWVLQKREEKKNTNKMKV